MKTVTLKTKQNKKVRKMCKFFFVNLFMRLYFFIFCFCLLISFICERSANWGTAYCHSFILSFFLLNSFFLSFSVSSVPIFLSFVPSAFLPSFQFFLSPTVLPSSLHGTVTTSDRDLELYFYITALTRFFSERPPSVSQHFFLDQGFSLTRELTVSCSKHILNWYYPLAKLHHIEEVLW